MERAVGKYVGVVVAKRRRNRAVCPKYQITKEKRVKVGESCTLAREKGGGSEREHEEERVGSMMKKGRFRGKSGQARGASLGEVEECMSG